MNPPAPPIGVLDVLGVLFSGAAAVGGIIAVIIAVRALTVARESSAYEQLFLASGDVLSSLQRLGRLGAKLGQVPNGHLRSRETMSDAFESFQAARARTELAFDSLGLDGDYSARTLDLASNFAANLLQADEFAGLSEEFAEDDVADTSWVDELSWKPSGPDVSVLARSAGFLAVRHSIDLVPEGVSQLTGLDKWWGERILEHDGYGHARSVYSVDASYLTQTARLLDDYTREYVQPMLSAAVRRVARSRRRLSPVR
jgi:hypothetical protein